MAKSPPKFRTVDRIHCVKSIALTLVFCLLFQEFSYASPQELKKLTNLDPQKPNLSWAKKLLPEIPESVASIEDAYQVPQGSDPSGTKTVILVQDAHTNSSCQLNESKLFDLLFEHGITNTVFTEAAKGNVNLTFLRNKASLSQREQIAKEYLQKGLLHGIEYLDLTSEHQFKIEGVEDPDLYFKSLKVYKDSVKKRDSFERYLNEIESTIDVLKSKLLNPFLLNFLQTKDKQKENLSDYIQTLMSQANTLKVDLSKYPNIQKLNNLRSLESKIDFKQATLEQQKAAQSLSSQDQKELSSVSISKLNMKDSQRGFFLLLEEKLKDQSKNYPNLSQYFHYLDQSKSLNPKDILKEQKDLEAQVLKALTTNVDEEKILQSIKTLNYYKKLFYLSLTPEEYEEFNHPRHFEGDSPRNPIQSEISHFVRNDMSDLKVLSGFLNLKLMNLKDRYDKAIFLKEDFTDIQNLCTQFYELTYQRDKAFLSNLLKAVEGNERPQGASAAGGAEPGRPFARSEELHEDKWAGAEAGPAANTYTLITGGYHTPNLKYLLRQQNISYISIVPQVTHETNIKRYEEILLNQPIPQNISLMNQPTPSKLMMDHFYMMGELPNSESVHFRERFNGGIKGGQHVTGNRSAVARERVRGPASARQSRGARLAVDDIEYSDDKHFVYTFDSTFLTGDLSEGFSEMAGQFKKWLDAHHEVVNGLRNYTITDRSIKLEFDYETVEWSRVDRLKDGPEGLDSNMRWEQKTVGVGGEAKKLTSKIDFIAWPDSKKPVSMALSAFPQIAGQDKAPYQGILEIKGDSKELLHSIVFEEGFFTLRLKSNRRAPLDFMGHSMDTTLTVDGRNAGPLGGHNIWYKKWLKAIDFPVESRLRFASATVSELSPYEMEIIMNEKAEVSHEIRRFRDALVMVKPTNNTLRDELAKLKEQVILQIMPGPELIVPNFLIEDLGFDPKKVYAIDTWFKEDAIDNPQFRESRYVMDRMENFPSAWSGVQFERVFGFYVFGGGDLLINVNQAAQSIFKNLKPGGSLIVNALDLSGMKKLKKIFGRPEFFPKFDTGLYVFSKKSDQQSAARLSSFASTSTGPR